MLSGIYTVNIRFIPSHLWSSFKIPRHYQLSFGSYKRISVLPPPHLWWYYGWERGLIYFISWNYLSLFYIMKTQTFSLKENHGHGLWCGTDCLRREGARISCSWLDLYSLDLHTPEPTAWPFDMVFEFGYWEGRIKIEQLCVGFIFGLEARDMALSAPLGTQELG